MSEIRWEVYSDLIPLSGRPKVLGIVHAPDKATALTLATAKHGTRILVQSVASRKVAAREPSALTPMHTREELLARIQFNAMRQRRRASKKTAANDTAVTVTPADPSSSTPETLP